MDAGRPKCNGTSKQSGRRCKRDPAIGLDKCAIHCGLSKAERERIAADFLAEQTARRAVITYGLPRDISAIDALLEEVRYTAGHVAWLRERVAETEQNALVWGVTEETDTQASEFPGTNTTRAAKPNVWLQLYREERRHLVDVTKAAISAGIEERRVKLAEAQGAMLNGVLKKIFARLSLSPEQSALLPLVVPEELRRAAAMASAN
jgi:hypothetical protein